MTKFSAAQIIMREWREKWINAAIQAYYKLHPKPRQTKKPELSASSTGFNKVYLRNSQGELIAIYGSTTGYFWKIGPKKIKKYSIKIKINQPRILKPRSTKTK